MEPVLTLGLLCVLFGLGQMNPPDVGNVTLSARNETTLTFQWDIVEGNRTYNYTLECTNGCDRQPITVPETGLVVTHTVQFLKPGTNYSFTLFTVFMENRSKGYNFSEVTVPLNVDSVEVFERNQSAITLRWNNVGKLYTYHLKYGNVEMGPISQTDSPSVEYTVTSLSPGTKYLFTVYTDFGTVRSSGVNFSTLTVPSDVEKVHVKDINDTYVFLRWDLVSNLDNNTYNYILQYRNPVDNIVISENGSDATRYLFDLTPATNYSFTLYTEFYNVSSNGYNFYHKTNLSSINEVKVTRLPTELTIAWYKLNNNDIYNYTLKSNRKDEIHFTGSNSSQEITHKYQYLTPGTEYSFTLFTTVNNARDSGHNFTTITTIDCASFNWTVTNSSIDAQVNGSTFVEAKNSSGSVQKAAVQGNRVHLQDLYPGENYSVSLFYELKSEKLLQCSHHLMLTPNSVSHLHCKYYSGGYGLDVLWDRPYGVVDVVQVDVNGKSFNSSQSSDQSTRQIVTGLQAAQWYKVTATSFSGAKLSQTVSVDCQTDPAGVIAGVLVFFLLVIIICAGIFIWIRYGSTMRKKRSTQPPVESKASNKKYKPIPMDKFPEHFQNMNCDDNRGFSAEYEDLSSVGVEQCNVAALLPENKDKNRFSNVLPYDSSRVHLTINDDGESDYINANYMPGYGNASRQYIAAQGPLPSTVNDFWRMVWEKRSEAIVMVTNCTEGGRVKCEQYWPLDYMPCVYGNLLVTVKSEEKARSWTLREFNVKNKSTCETRTVRHFHFTAWPDHGVPIGTEDLIEFRGLVRQHIETSSSAGPTVVHCSAGVGRTGTLIALDVLLQQLDKEKAVGIVAFVHEMRLRRPLMVQTESQYVFLHQCIMDSLQPKVDPKSESLYENSDMIYVNAIALRDYHKGSQI